MKDEQKIVDMINEIASAFEEHGGDVGGPYYIMEKEAKEVLEKAIETFNIDKNKWQVKSNEDEIRIVKINI